MAIIRNSATEPQNPQKWTARDIELAVTNPGSVKAFPFTRYVCIPNVSFGFLNHEADILCIDKAGRLYEVEIKVSKADIKADALKSHGHEDNRIYALYFAVPEELREFALENIPEHAGLLVCHRLPRRPKPYCIMHKHAKPKSDYKATTEDRLKLMRLGCMRYWRGNRKEYNHAH